MFVFRKNDRSVSKSERIQCHRAAQRRSPLPLRDVPDGGGAEESGRQHPETNIRLGCWYLKWLDEKFSGVQETGLAAYNAGHGNVAKWLADEEKSRDGMKLDEIPFGETKSYVKRVQLAEKLYRIAYRF